MRKTIVGRITPAGFQSEQPTASKLDDMLASRVAPGLGTDTQFFQGLGTRDPFESVPSEMREFYRQRAVASGVNPNGKQYLSSLARFPGDPQALVESRADIERVCDKEGFGCQGIVSRKVRQDAPDEIKPHIADDLLDTATADSLVEQGTETCSVKEWTDAREQTRTRLLGHTTPLDGAIDIE